eukprot:9480699-Pyramimonas_sp.AAC.1
MNTLYIIHVSCQRLAAAQLCNDAVECGAVVCARASLHICPLPAASPCWLSPLHVRPRRRAWGAGGWRGPPSQWALLLLIALMKNNRNGGGW